MFHQVSWLTYSVSILSLTAVYYLYVGLTFYRVELQSGIYKTLGKEPVVKAAAYGDLQLPDDAIMGRAQPDDVEFVSQEELTFAPADDPEEISTQPPAKTPVAPGTDSQLIGEFSEMVSEVKTLIRVINESSESKENFEMLFCLIIQKYSALRGTAYQQRVNEFLINESEGLFPFGITYPELEEYWKNY
jgi:hypothetical protein